MASWEEVTCHENHQNWWWDILPIGVLNSSRSGSETELSDSNNSSSSDSNSDSSSDSDENKSVGGETSETEDEEIDDNNTEGSVEDSSAGSATGTKISYFLKFLTRNFFLMRKKIATF